ncbi:hypothetical protein [Ideonella sp. A 288]|uniref:hypothetical protein n=1 Tax=Ideonella sp. A 288 TaxID=1962181 RepID=UPI000B4B1EE1|nr:hypothetical protein [Ideonella sp. A 288]
MIHIQIANTLSEDGVGDIRWVLLDPSESPAAAPAIAEATTAEAAGAAPRDPDPSPHTGREADWTYQVLRVLVLASALAGALWLASSTLERRGPMVKAPMAAASARP